MKKKFFTLIAVLIFVFSLCVFAEEGIFVIGKMGDYQKFATQKQLIPPPRGPVVTVYQNFGIMDAEGNVVVEPIYREIFDFYDGRSLFVTQQGKCGYFDENFNIVIEPIYRSGNSFSDGLALVTDENYAYGFIDTNGNTVIPHTLDYARPFENGVAVVGKVDVGYFDQRFIRTGMIDKECRMISPIKYDWEDYFDVQMSQNNININGSVYKNSDLEYPFINYLGYTYIPLSFYTCYHLGFATTWNPVDGLVVTAPGNVQAIGGENERFENVLGKNDMVEGEIFKAQLYHGSVTIAGETYTADDVYYPLLTYRDVVYIPVLWRQGMEGMGLEYSYDLETTSLVFKTKQ